MTKLKIKLFLFLLLISTNLVAQWPSERDNNGNNFIITTGYYRTQYNIAELTMGYGHTTSEELYVDLSYVSAGTELLFDKNKTYLCPKISYEFDMMIFSLKGNFVYLTDFNSDGYILRPELGLSVFGYANLNYCYNINIANKTSLSQTHGIHLQVNLFPGQRNSGGM